MVSTEHIDNQKSEKRPWLKPPMRVIAIVLPLVGSFALVWAIFIILSTDAGGLAIMRGLLLGLVSAFLFRSWWAVLIVPIAFTAGTLLAFYLIPLVLSPNPLAMGDAPLGFFLWEVIGPITAVIGALFGTFIDKKARKQSRQQ